MWQRWNQTTHIFEKSTDDGGSWTPLGLSGSIISEGTVADARLSSNVPLKNAANQFSDSQMILKTGEVDWSLYNNGGVSEWHMRQKAGGTSNSWFLSSAVAGVFTDRMEMTTGGILLLGQGIRERGRTVDMGIPIDVAHAGGNYTGTGATWTVDAGDQQRYAYTMIAGNIMLIEWDLSTTTTSAATATSLNIAIPGGKTARSAGGFVRCGSFAFNGGGVTWEQGWVQAAAGANVINLFRTALAAFPAATNLLDCRGYAILSVN